MLNDFFSLLAIFILLMQKIRKAEEKLIGRVEVKIIVSEKFEYIYI